MRVPILGLLLLSACATGGTSAARPTITMVSDGVQVCRDGGGFRVGQPVRFVRSVCEPLNAKSAVVHCTPRPIADGEVMRVEGARCAAVRLAAGATLDSADGVDLAAR
jgi:hypothetical protein